MSRQKQTGAALGNMTEQGIEAVNEMSQQVAAQQKADRERREEKLARLRRREKIYGPSVWLELSPRERAEMELAEREALEIMSL